MKRALPPEAAACALAAALIAAASLPGNRFGLAASLVAGGVIVTALFVRGGERLFLLPALALALAPLVRDAGWIVAPDLAAALALAALSAARATHWAAMRAALGCTLRSLFPALPAVLAPAARALTPERTRSALPFLRGLALGAVLLVVFGTLFVSADAAFAEVVNKTLIPDWSLGRLPERGFVFALVAALAGALALTASQPLAAAAPAGRPARLQPAEWIPALALLDLLFAAFVGVQLAVLFGGHDHVLGTTGLTYAEYARQGFVELIVAAALTLAVAGLAARHAARHSALQRRALLLLGGLLFALTLVVLASALRRLGLYEDAFGFTRARLLAHGIILWLGALFVVAAACAGLGRAAQLPRISVALTALALVVATAANPDALIAKRNADRFAQTGHVDTYYLAGLSADAVPELTKLPAGVRGCVFNERADSLERGDSLAEANLARSRARRALAGMPPSSCTR